MLGRQPFYASLPHPPIEILEVFGVGFAVEKRRGPIRLRAAVTARNEPSTVEPDFDARGFKVFGIRPETNGNILVVVVVFGDQLGAAEGEELGRGDS